MHDLSRRRFLRGGGSVAIGLPFLLARQGDTRAQPGAVPERLITLFYGEGLPKEVSEKGFEGALAALKPHAPKLTMVRNLNVLAEGPGNGHVKGSAGFACGLDSPSADTKGGPSLDWVAYQHFKPNTPLPTLSTGVYGADDAHERMRIVHSWRGLKKPNEPIPDTLQLFHALFGGPEMMSGSDPAAVRRARYKVSVLDAVMAEYKQVTSEAAGYPRAVRTLISDHAETVRELEKQAIDQHRFLTTGAGVPTGCKAPGAPTRLNVLENKRPEHWDKAWPIMVDLYVLALRCDLVRFGNLMVLSGGDRFPWSGPAGSVANGHADVYHRWPRDNAAIMLDIVRWKMGKIAHFLSRLDDPTFKEANGATLLDNTTVVIGTELGDPAAHGRTHMTFMLAGGRRRFRPGVHTLTDRTDVELYNTVLRGMAMDMRFGDMRYYRDTLPLLA